MRSRICSSLGFLVATAALGGQARVIDATVLDKVYPSEQVVAGLGGSLRALAACFKGKRGEIAFEIAPNGKSAQVTVSGELDSPCVERESARWRFDRPTGDETPQVFVTLELAAEAKDAALPDRERGEFDSFCSLIQQLQPRTNDPRELPKKALRTLLASGMTTSGQRWAQDMLRAPAEAQLAEFEASAMERGFTVECPEYVGWHQRNYPGASGSAPFELVLIAAEGPALRGLLRNRTVSAQWLLIDEELQPDRLEVLDAAGKKVVPFDERSRRKFDNTVYRTSYRSLPAAGALHVHDEPLKDLELHWGPWVYSLPPGEYRARMVFTSATDEWIDAEAKTRGTLKGVWKGTVQSNEVRFFVK